MNKVKEFFENITNDKLEICIQELYVFEETGVLNEGTELRKLVKEYCEITGQPFHAGILPTTYSILIQFAKRHLPPSK